MIISKLKLSYPCQATLNKSFKLANLVKKPISFNFYIDSLKGNIWIKCTNDKKIIFKSNNEHSSPIKSTFKVNDEYIVLTENTIYVISASTKVKLIN